MVSKVSVLVPSVIVPAASPGEGDRHRGAQRAQVNGIAAVAATNRVAAEAIKHDEGVAAFAPVEQIVAGAAGQRVVACAARERGTSGGRARVQPVGAGGALYDLDLGEGGATAAVEEARRAGLVTGEQDICAAGSSGVFEGQCVIAQPGFPADDDVVAVPAAHLDVVAVLLAKDRVVAAPACQTVLAKAAVDGIGPTPAIDRVAASATQHRIRAAHGIDVGPGAVGAGIHQVGIVGQDQMFGLCKGDGIGTIRDRSG